MAKNTDEDLEVCEGLLEGLLRAGVFSERAVKLALTRVRAVRTASSAAAQVQSYAQLSADLAAARAQAAERASAQQLLDSAFGLAGSAEPVVVNAGATQIFGAR